MQQTLSECVRTQEGQIGVLRASDFIAHLLCSLYLHLRVGSDLIRPLGNWFWFQLKSFNPT